MKKKIAQLAAGVVLTAAILAGVLGFHANATSSVQATASHAGQSQLLAEECYAGEGHC